MLATNQVLHQGRYRIIIPFGQDEAGQMYEAYDTVSNTNVVLRESVGKGGKVVTSGQLEAINAEFAGGAKALTEITHESLVSVQDYFSEIDRQYLVLESVTGHDLTKFLEPGEERPALPDLMSWADQLLNALHYLHKLLPPVVHREIRPANIKLTSNLKVKLLTAAIPAALPADAVMPIAGQTPANTSFNYKPLEQLWGGLDSASQRVILNSYDEKSAGVLLRPPDARSDLYSVAASLYHVLTGAVPCDALERSIAMLDGKPDPLQKPADLDAGIPPEISDVFMRAMAIRRENRFDSAVIMRQVLRTSVVRVEERQSGLSETVEAKDANPPTEVVPGGATLELERTRAEARQLEIEAEQKRLEEERKRIDQRRQELEAEREQTAERERLQAEQEHKRLEKENLDQEAELERQRVAEKLADLEAEASRERAEQERLEREAEAERTRAQERLQELQTEQEHHRAEQKRIEAEAKQELERGEQRIREISGFDLDVSEGIDDDETLLELDSGQPSPPVQQMGRVADCLVQDENAEPVTEDTAYRPAATFDIDSIADIDDSPVLAYQEQPGFNWRVPVIAGAAVLLIAAGVGVWQFMSVAEPSATPVQTTFSADQQGQPPAAEQPAEADPSAAAVPLDEPANIDPTARAVQSNPAQDRLKKPAPAAAKTPPPKKKVTVDDLINDN